MTADTIRRAKWVAAVLALVVVVVGAGSSHNLTGVEQQNPLDYLPPHAQSTLVEQLESHFPAGQSEQAIVVFYRSSGLTADDLTLAHDDRAAVGTHYIPGQTPPTPVVVSPNRTTAYFSTTLPIADNLESIVYEVKQIRSLVGTGSNGLQIAVTGSAAYLTDGANALQGNGGTLLLVAVLIAALLLLVVYRSPVLWLLPLLCVFGSLLVSEGFAAVLGKHALTVTGQAAGILTVLVIGVGTDYGLLLISRYREELRTHDDHHEALAIAIRRAGPAVIASGATVALALCCLLASSLTSDRGLGPVCAIGVVVTVCFMLVVLPALLALLGRRVFWPYVPVVAGQTPAPGGAPTWDQPAESPWARLAGTVVRRHRTVGAVTGAVLVVLCLGLAGLHTDLTAAEQYRSAVGSVQGQNLLAEGFPGGTAAPLVVMVQPAADVSTAQRIAGTVAGVASVGHHVTVVDGVARFEVVTEGAEATPAANSTIVSLRGALSHGIGTGALVGGPSAVDYDVEQGTIHDEHLVIPLVLVVVLVVLLALLRALVGPVLLVLSVILSFGAALGVTAVLDAALYHASSPYLPLYGFLFLVALGCDYNIFLTARVREEAAAHGTREGTRRALSTTGAVIASAGIVLAGTFAALSIEPLVVLAELGFLVAFGVLLDTFVVRTFLVPSLVIELGDRWWWPGPVPSGSAAGAGGGGVVALEVAPAAGVVEVAAPVASPPPANWYPDPWGDPALLRYWDGTRWTGHTAPRG